MCLQYMYDSQVELPNCKLQHVHAQRLYSQPMTQTHCNHTQTQVQAQHPYTQLNSYQEKLQETVPAFTQKTKCYQLQNHQTQQPEVQTQATPYSLFQHQFSQYQQKQTEIFQSSQKFSQPQSKLNESISTVPQSVPCVPYLPSLQVKLIELFVSII